MSSSPTPPSHNTQSRLLIEQANSHGSYLWGGTDIENALRWFSPRPTSSLEAKENNRSTTEPSSNSTQTIQPSVEEEGNDFLRLLLQSRGIWNPRPSKRRGASNNNSSSAKHHDKSKRRKKGRLNEEANNRNRNDDKTSRLGTNDKPLQSVLSGYYQLVHQSTNATPSEPSLGNDVDNSNNNDSNETIAADENMALTMEASTNLYNDLTTIISSRQHTHEIYQAALHTTIQSKHTHDSCTSLSTSNEQHRRNNSNDMAIKIDEYMVHPTTCTRRVYASTLYDRLLSLAPTHDNNYKEKKQLAESKGVQKFLQKLFGLAAVNDANGKIREVILLMVLEPLRRMQVRKMTRLIETKRGGNEMIPPQDDQGVASSSSILQEEHSMELYPLLISQRLAKTVSNDKSQSAALNDKEEDDSSSSSSCPLITLLVKSILHNNDLDKWWTQPSQLLCVISQYHFPIASSYLHYWIDRAIDTHANLYQDTTSMSHEEEEATSFHQALERIQQFHQTSDRLRSLVAHVLHNKEEEISASSLHSGLTDDDDDDDKEEEEKLFCRSLALTAIKRALA